jgi:hypothetical protein
MEYMEETVWLPPIYRMNLCFFAEYAELCKSSSRFALSLFSEYGEYSSVPSPKKLNGTVHTPSVLKLKQCIFAKYTQNYLKFKYLGDFEAKIKNKVGG